MLNNPTEQTDAAVPFRARLRARDAVRPQPTLSILTHSKPITTPPSALRLPPPVQTPAVSRPPVPVAPVAQPMRALKPEPPKPAPKPVRTEVIAPAAIGPQSGPSGSGARRDGDGDDGRSRLGEFSQFAFAGLAVLGLAGLSVMAAENALNGGRDKADSDDGTLNAESFPAASVSVAALGDATVPTGAETTPWFDYNGVADLLKARQEKFKAEEREAARLAEADADREAALAIANAEAARAASGSAAGSAGPTVIDTRLRDRLATEEAMRQADADAAARLLADQQAAAAKAEADRIAAEEAARAAAAQAEAKRLADLEAQRAAEAEAARLADLEAKKQAAEAEARRLAELEAKRAAEAAEAKRLADLEAKRAADAEAKRLADQAVARQAAEARRLAEVEARQTAEAEAARLAGVAAAKPAEPKRLSVPPAGVPSLKPSRPVTDQVLLADAGPKPVVPVTRTAPPSLAAGIPEVRPLALPRPVDDFIAERTEFTAGRALEAGGLASLRADFIALVEASPDGSHHELTTPDGRSLLIHFERTVPMDPVKVNAQAIGYRLDQTGVVQRAYFQPASVDVHVMCRDVAYAFPGQERGRFAACQDASGIWRMARATNLSATPI